MTTVSVIIPTFEREFMLRRTLASLEAEATADFEVVVVCDGSSDGTADFLATLHPRFPLVPVLLERNLGRARARNAGLERATGDIVIFLDDDMEIEPGFIAAHRALHAGSDGARAGVGNVRQNAAARRSAIGRYLGSRGAQKIRATAPLPWRYFSTNNASTPRALLAAVGGFDPGFRRYGFEDLELAFRLEQRCGASFHFVEGAIATHQELYTLDDVLAKKRLCGEHSLRVMLSKHPDMLERLGFDRYFTIRRDAKGLAYIRPVGIARPLFSETCYRPLLDLARASNPWTPAVLLDYLVIRNYYAGLRWPRRTI